MERRRRRLFTVAVTAGATLVILAAAASGVFQIAVQAVPGYRAKVEAQVRELTGRPVRIGALGLTWRYYYPSLELLGVALLAEDGQTPVLQAERLRLGFGLTRLLRGETMPNRLELQGLALDVRIARDGQVEVKGMEGETPAGEPLDALQPLTQFAQLRLERCRLNVRDERRRRAETYSFGIVHAELDRGLLNDALEAEVALPASIGDSAHFDAEFSGELLQPATWSGRAAVELTGLVAGSWLAPYLVRGATLEVSGAEARLEAQVEQGDVRTIDAHVKTAAVVGRRARHEAGFEALEARVNLEFVEQGWVARLKHFAIESRRGRWPAASGELRATRAEGETVVYDGTLNYVRLADVAPWLQLLPVPTALATLDAASGDVRELQFRLHHGDELRYGYRARFEDLALPAAERPAGFAGLRGELAGDERGGRAVVQESEVTLDLPGMLVTPQVPLDLFEAELEWRQLADGWRIGMPQFRWELWTTRGKGRFELLLPEDPGRSPELDLAAQFHADDATRAKPLMPLHWSAGLRNWLDRSIVNGRAPRAELRIRGPLRDFPFDERKTGEWTLDIDASDILLAYQPDWPPVEDLAAKLQFTGNTLAIEATHGIVAGNPIQAVTARFPDFGTGQLLIDGTVTGETARFYDFLGRSPLRETLKTLLSQTTATGPSAVEIHLDIPVRDAEKTRTAGRVTLDGVELRHGGLPQPIRDIRGVIDFAGDALSAERLTGMLYDVPLRATLTPRPGGGSVLDASFRVALDPAGTGPSELVPAWVRKNTAGASDWRARLPIGGGAGDDALALTTDMVGIEVKLPPPLGKPAADAVPLRLTIGATERAPLRVTADYRGRLGADLRFARSRGGLALDRGTLRIGDGPALAPEERGLVIAGQLAELDLRAWAGELEGAGLEQQISTIRRADLHVGRAFWDRYALRDARYQWAAQKDGWSVSLVGAGGVGEIRWSEANRGQITARMDQLALDLLPVNGADEPGGAPIDPNALPLLDFDIRRVAIGPADLGHVTLVTQRTEMGQKTRSLGITGGSVTLSGEGEWRRRAGQSSAVFNADFATSDIAALLRGFGYTANLDAKAARARGALTWAPSEQGLEWHQAQGTVHIDFENGQLRAVEPGAGRVLGLVNFYALPRRLTLNFRDVLGSGLGFDRITGEFELRDGNARTENLRIQGPSLRMDVRGRIGLAARDYDQEVLVYPDVSAGVTLGALALGGPVAGALALIAQEVLNKPLNQVTQLSYRVTGSWDNPQVTRSGGPLQQDEPPRRSPGPASQKP